MNLPATATLDERMPVRATQPRAATVDELVKRAVALQPLLRKNAAESERNRRAADENIAAIADAGLFRLMVSKRYGGYEGTLRAHLDVSSALGEACGGTAWAVALTNVCAWFAGLYGTRAQDDVYRSNPDARIAGVLAGSPDSRRVPGGLRVSGKWFWSSGVLHADWCEVGVLEHDQNGALVAHWLALVPMTDVKIEDTWYTAGMRASGSNCVVANDVFVPDHRLLNLIEAVDCRYATEAMDEPTFRSAFMPVAALILVGPQLGMGRAGLKYVIEKAPSKAISYTSFGKQTDSAVFHLQVAQAALKINTAHLHAYAAADEVDAAARRSVKLDYLTRARMRADTGLVVSHITTALDELISAHGAGSFAEVCPLQRMWRDSNTAARHAIALPAVANEIYGKALLGVGNTVSPLV